MPVPEKVRLSSLDYDVSDGELKNERLRTGGEQSLTGKLVAGRKPASCCRSRAAALRYEYF